MDQLIQSIREIRDDQATTSEQAFLLNQAIACLQIMDDFRPTDSTRHDVAFGVVLDAVFDRAAVREQLQLAYSFVKGAKAPGKACSHTEKLHALAEQIKSAWEFL